LIFILQNTQGSLNDGHHLTDLSEKAKVKISPSKLIVLNLMNKEAINIGYRLEVRKDTDLRISLNL
jgi:hypothetical protein